VRPRLKCCEALSDMSDIIIARTSARPCPDVWHRSMARLSLNENEDGAAHGRQSLPSRWSGRFPRADLARQYRRRRNRLASSRGKDGIVERARSTPVRRRDSSQHQPRPVLFIEMNAVVGRTSPFGRLGPDEDEFHGRRRACGYGGEPGLLARGMCRSAAWEHPRVARTGSTALAALLDG